MSWAAPDLVHLMSSPATMEPAFRLIRGQCFANSFQNNPARLAKKFCHWEKFGCHFSPVLFNWDRTLSDSKSVNGPVFQ
jgi:hypothetical protein